jgi:hypothetical protein
MGTLAGIARHARPKAPMALLDHAHVTIDGGGEIAIDDEIRIEQS